MAVNPKISYLQGDQSMLDQVQAMWEALNGYHYKRSTHFKDHYNNMTFQKRKADLLKKTCGGQLHVDLGVDAETGQGVGYLISSVNADKIGEIDSLFVRERYRGLGVGSRLVENALNWMVQVGAVEKIVEVSFGNDATWEFYGRFGFLPRKTVLKHAKKP